jgi:LytR cell envelope-related transcriptional attenuator
MLRALAANALGRNLANPIRANALVGSVVRSLTKDDRLTIRRSVTLARQFRSFDLARLTTLTLPVDRAVQRDGVVHRAGQPGFEPALRQGWEQVLLPRQPAAHATVAKLLTRPTGPTPPATTAPAPPTGPVAPANISVTVKNATPRQGLAAQVTARLKTLGFKATNGGNAPPSAVTTLTHAKGSVAANTVARVVKVDGERVTQVGQPGLGASSVALVLGSDFKGLASGAALPKPAAPRPPKQTAATRDLPPWDPRPC